MPSPSPRTTPPTKMGLMTTLMPIVAAKVLASFASPLSSSSRPAVVAMSPNASVRNIFMSPTAASETIPVA